MDLADVMCPIGLRGPGRFNVSYRPTWTRADLMCPIGLHGPGPI